ncbi:MAG: flagellar motor protein MotA [Alphaproteobacteria bacterium]|nr:flagellar motor protein MotA [Alphaproteobacteria bacterium]
MTGTRRFLTRMGLFLIGVVAVAGVSFPVLVRAFEANPALNAMILLVLLLGIVFIFRQVTMLQPEIAWLESFRRGQAAASNPNTRLLAPMASMLGERKGRLTLSATATRALLDTIGARLDEGRDISRYLIGLMILLGLLGTFYGLMQTVGSVGDVVGRLSMGGGDATTAFEDLKRGLSAPLSAMGTAFGASLFGLAGSLVLGFLDIQAGQAQNRFYNELEEWLSTQTRLGSGGPAALADGEQSVPAYIQALLEQTAESLDGLQRTIARGEDGRLQANQNLTALTDKLSVLADQMRAEQTLMLRLAENQTEMKPVIARLADVLDKGSMGIDEASRSHIRNLDNHLARLLEDTTQGRAQIIQDVRSEIRLLARTIAALAEEER